MELGRHLAELWRIRHAVAGCLVLALVAAVVATHKVSLLPPELSPRALEIASASTDVLVDTPKSAVLDLRQDLFDITSLTNRAVLLGNVMASPTVLAYIGRRAGVRPDAIEAVTPRTPNSPRPFVSPGNEKRATDLLRSTGQYRLSIEANPTVPVLKIYAQAPTAKAAQELANSSVDGLRDYLVQQAVARGVQRDKQVRLVQLGRAHGAVINGGVRFDVALLTFLVVFTLAATAAIFVARVRRGFELAERERHAAQRGGTGEGDARSAASTDADESLAIR